MNQTTAYPLCWPTGWKRTHVQISSRFGKWQKPVTIAHATNTILDELRKMGIGDWNVIISTNLRLKQDGFPYSNQRDPDDVGASVWWKDCGHQRVIALNQYDRVADNLYAIGKTIEAMRDIDRWGGGEMLERTFTGFTALPNPDKTDWRTVLGVGESNSIKLIKINYRELVSLYHPDKEGSDTDKFIEARKAYEQAKKELGF